MSQHEVIKCNCGHRACKDYHVSPLLDVHGVKLSKEQAEAIATVLNKSAQLYITLSTSDESISHGPFSEVELIGDRLYGDNELIAMSDPEYKNWETDRGQTWPTVLISSIKPTEVTSL